MAGSTSYTSATFTLDGAGADIWGLIDEFHYVYQPLNNDGEIIARVKSQANTSGWAKAGVMIKESTASGSSYVMMAVTPLNG